MVKQNKRPSNKKNEPQSKRKYFKFIATALIILLSIPAFIILAIGSIQLSKAIHVNNVKRAITREVPINRSANAAHYDALRQEKINLLASEGVIDTSLQSYNEKVDTCKLSGDVGGWVYTNWQQICYFTYTDYLPISLAKEDLITKLTSSPSISKLIGARVEYYSTGSCELLRDVAPSSTLNYVDSTSPASKCPFNTPTKGDVGDIVSDPYAIAETRIIRTFHPDEIDRSHNYIELRSFNRYFKSEKLGCKPIMCDSPLEAPVSSF